MINEANFSDMTDAKENTNQNAGEDTHESPENLPVETKPFASKLGLLEIKCSNRLKQGIYILVALFLMIIIPTVTWYSIKANKNVAQPRVEKVISENIECSKSNGRIECSCGDGLIWNGTHCSDRVNGSWCGWLPASPCSVSCGNGYQDMIRYCECPAPENGGTYCGGKNRLSHPCNPRNCTIRKEEKVNGGWCEWHPASFCNVSCGYGHQEVVRYCSCPGPKNGGSYCNGTAKAFHPCHATNCSSVGEKNKVNGSWCEWFPISPCNVSCGNGYQDMIRYCECPAPENGGTYCSGSSKTVRNCSQEVCKNERKAEMCNFEYELNKEPCHWTEDKSDDFDWSQSVQSPKVYTTGPTTDHTFRPKDGGNYMFINSGGRNYLDRARLISRLQSPTSGSCFSFWYNMNGRGIGQLNIYKVAGSEFQLMWNKSGDHENRWNYGAIHFNSTEPYQLAIDGVVGKGNNGSKPYGNIAIDDIMISSGVCSFPDPLPCNYTYNTSSPYYQYLKSPFYPECYADNLHCHYHFETRLGYVFKFTFNDMRLQNSSACIKDSLKMYENGALQKTFCGKYSRTFDLISSGNKLLFVFRSDKSIFDNGFSASFVAIKKPCKFTFKSSSGNFSFHLYPEGEVCLYSIMLDYGKFIKVDFTVSPPHQFGYCGSGRIGIHENSINSYEKAYYCGNVPMTYTSQSNVIHMVYNSNESPAKRNFFAQYSSIDKPCSYNVTSSSNHFASPNRPYQYPNNMYCKYHFKVSNNNYMKIWMTYFHLEQSPSCVKDSVALYEGGSVLQGKICGTRSSDSWTSKGSEVLLIFQADGTNPSYGFTGYISEMKKPCRYVFSSHNGSFTSPQDPDYLQGAQCLYEINVGNGFSVDIDFPVFSLPVVRGCSSYVYVTIYENALDYRTVKLQLSGNATKSFQSFSNKVYLKFFSSSFCPRTIGFRANYSATSQVCRYLIDSPPYRFTTPGFPGHYPHNSSCQYHIKVPSDKAVKIYFGDFSLESSDGCRNDSLKIYERGRLKATLCGNRRYTVWSSVESEVMMTFQSDSSSSSSGIYGNCELIDKPLDESFYGSTGNFTSPGFPGAHPRSKQCTYHITVAKGKSIKIDFKTYSLRQSSTCDQEYIAVYEDVISKDTLRSQFCGNGSRTYHSFGNRVHIVFNPVYYSTLPLFYANYSEVDRDCTFIITPPYDKIASPGYPSNYPNNITCRYYFKFLSGKKLMINFNSFLLQPSPLCKNDLVSFYENGVLKATHCGNNLRQYTAERHEVLMIFQTDAASSFKGFYGQLLLKEKEISPCKSKFTAPSGYFASPGFPARYPRGKNCIYRIEVEKGRSIKIDFTVMELSCIDEHVSIYEDDSYQGNLKSKLCGVGSKSFRSVSNNLYILFTPTVYYRPKYGFSAYYQTVDRECKYILTPPSYWFSSPLPYLNTTYCQYVFRVTDSKAIQINFDYMSLRSSASCSIDSIKIYENGELKATFCGRGWYRKWTSKESEVLMVFQSNGSFSSNEFKGRFALVDKPCDYTFTSPSGSFKSPAIPCNFARGTECRYHITVANGKGVRIEFPVFQLLDSNLCNDEYVAVYEDSIRYETRKVTFCGNKSRTFQSYSNKIHVVFHSSLFHKSFQGFHATYSETERSCSYNLSPPSYIFASPGYPSWFPSNLYCEYHLKVPRGKNLVMFFKKLALESSPSCTNALIKLYENNTLRETFCGESPVTTWSSTSNEVVMIFQSTTSATSKGFYGFYSLINKPCFNSYTTESGNFSSAGYPNKYQNDLKCDYRIKVKQGNVINLNFHPFDLEYSLTCSYDYLKIYNVFLSSINLGATLCGTGARTFRSNSSEILIEFRSDESVSGNGFFASYVAVN